jgi:glycosyltransferase involved in cell wall biosynthesis
VLNTPLVSVIMSVKNETLWLEQAVTDILSQSYSNLELLIIDDGSDIPVEESLSCSKHAQITIYRNPTSIGQAASRNFAFDKAKGVFIAIADADDRYHPKRIEKQVSFLQANPHIHLCGTDFNTLPTGKSWPIFSHPNHIRAAFVMNNPIVHSSAMFRSSLLSQGFQYDTAYNTAEDYELFSRFRLQLHYANIKDKLVTYRLSERTGAAGPQFDLAAKIRTQVIQEEQLEDCEKELQQLAAFIPGFVPFSQNKLLLCQIQKQPKALYTILYNQYLQYTQKFRIKPDFRMILKALYYAKLPLKTKFKLLIKY